MKLKTLSAVIIVLTAGQSALSDITKKPIKNAKVVIFDAICEPVSTSKGYLQVNLQAENRSKTFFVEGSFYSYNDRDADDPDWDLLPLQKCKKLQKELTKVAGRNILLNGNIYEKPYDSYEDVWGTCRSHLLDGRELYPCKTGTRKIIKVYRDIVLDFNGTLILNKNY